LLVLEGNYIHQAKFEDAATYLYESLSSKMDVSEKIHFIALASVLSEDAEKRFLLQVKNLFGIEVRVAKVTPVLCDVECGYEDYSRLGVDRWLALVAAFQHYQGAVCVVDCGSALTIDMVNSAGKHLGGFISPGLSMSIKALLGQTQAVRFESDSFSPNLEWGVNTAKAVQNGALLGNIGAIKEAWDRFVKFEDELEPNKKARLILTGGDATLLARFLDVSFEQVDDLVLQGLRLAF